MNPILLDVLYSGALVAGSPYFLYRMATQGKYREGLGQKLGFVRRREGAPCIWVHGVSVGEVLSARTMVAALEREFPEVPIVISTTTSTGQAVARRTYSGREVFYWPLDFSGAVATTFRRIRPRMVVLMELEVWPNFLARARSLGVPVIVANGRITERSVRRWKRLGSFAGGLMKEVDLYLVQTGVYARRLGTLGVPPEKIEVAGNIKFDTLSTDVDANRAVKLREEMGVARDEALVIGGSTHNTEEEALLDAYARLRQGGSKVRLLIVPRHDTRFREVAALVASRGYKLLRRSQMRSGAKPTGGEVILADTMGELATLYEAADVAFVGGSLVPQGGQNMMEPAAKGKPVVFGPHVDNFPDASVMLLEAGAATQAKGRGELADALGKYIGTQAGLDAGSAGRQAVMRAKGATARTVERIAGVLRANQRQSP